MTSQNIFRGLPYETRQQDFYEHSVSKSLLTHKWWCWEYQGLESGLKHVNARRSCQRVANIILPEAKAEVFQFSGLTKCESLYSASRNVSQTF